MEKRWEKDGRKMNYHETINQYIWEKIGKDEEKMGKRREKDGKKMRKRWKKRWEKDGTKMGKRCESMNHHETINQYIKMNQQKYELAKNQQ